MGIKRIYIDELKPGMELGQDVYTEDKKYLLIRKGTVLSRDLIQGLKRRGLESILILDNASRGGALPGEKIKLPLPPDPVRRKDIPFTFPSSLENRLFVDIGGKPVLKIDSPHVYKTKKKAVEAVHRVLEKISKEKKLDYDSMSSTAQSLLEVVTENRAAVLNISGMRIADEYTFVHSVNVAAYTSVLAKDFGMDGEELKKLCTGALCHDVGKMLIREEVLNKPGRLTDEEFEEMKAHTTLGYNLLKENGIEEEIASIALYHHERIDGSGYPMGLKEEQLPISAQMTAITDVYDALTSDRVYKKAIESNNAMMIIVSESGKHFNPKLVSIFQRAVGIYPIGSLVKLNNGYIARILEQNEGIVRPIIQIIYDNEGKPVEDKVVLNLMDNRELYIVEGLIDKKAA